MRFYELKIGKNITFSSRPKSLLQNLTSFKQTAPLHFEFEVNTFENNINMTCGFVRLYNIDVSFFLLAKDLIGESIVLRAGWENSVFARKLGWQPITDDLLINMEISNTLADFSGTNPFLDIFFIPKTKDVKEEIEGEEVAEQLPQFKTEINKGELVYEKVSKTLGDIVSNTMSITSYGQGILNLTNTGTQTILITGKLLGDYIINLQKAFNNIGCQINPKQKAIYLYQHALEDSLMDEINRNNAIILGNNELITQPQLINIAGQLSVVLRMRPDINTGSVVFLKGNFPSTQGFNTGNNTLSTHINPQSIFQQGFYIVLSVNHKGSYHSTSASDWATTLTLSPMDSQRFSK